MSTELTNAELTQLREQVAKLREENERLRDGIVIVDCCPACLLKGAKIAELEEKLREEQAVGEKLASFPNDRCSYCPATDICEDGGVFELDCCKTRIQWARHEVRNDEG